jgi:hypothetical protein
MAANRTFLAMTTGRLRAPAGGLRPAILAHDASSTLALSLALPIGCRA